MNRGEAYERAAALYDTAVRHHMAHCKEGGRGTWIAVTTEPAAYARRVLRIAEFLAADVPTVDPADDQATTAAVLRALLAYVETDDDLIRYHPNEIMAWLSSLIAARWTPERVAS